MTLNEAPKLPSDREEANLLLRVLCDFAEAALTMLELSETDMEAWARGDWDDLSPRARGAANVLGVIEPTAYQNALDAVAEELRALLEDVPAPR